MRLGNQRWKIYLGVLLFGLAYLAQPLRLGIIHGSSMDPTLRDGQPYLLDTRAYARSAPQRGEVVVFQREGITYIKRVIALEGDTLLLQLFQNESWDEMVYQEELPRLRRLLASPHTHNWFQLQSLTIPPGSVYVVGDMRRAAQDSRTYGPVPVSSILGRVPAPPAPETSRLAARFLAHNRL
jgi:signal peptidase I